MPEPQYQNFDFKLPNKGLVARFAVDAAPEDAYLNTNNWESRFENAMTTRLGMSPEGGGNCGASAHTLGRMLSLNGANYDYVGVSTALKRSSNTGTSYTTISNGMSGNPFTVINSSPFLTNDPYAFFADSGQMVKDNGSFSGVEIWGIQPPTTPPTAVVKAGDVTSIEPFEVDSGFGYGAGVASHSAVIQVNTTLSVTIGSTGLQSATPADMTNIVIGSYLNIDTGGSAESVYVISVDSTSFRANFTKTHSSGVAITDTAIAMTSTGILTPSPIYKLGSYNLNTPGAAGLNNGSDTFSILFKATEIIGVGNLDIIFSNAGGAYTASFTQIDFTGQDSGTNNDTWLAFTKTRSQFAVSGAPNWGTITQVTVQVMFNEVATNFDFAINDLLLLVSGPDTTGGVAYDYRYTYYNSATGAESNPTPVWSSYRYIGPINQPVLVTMAISSDPQVTDIRVYRRGGSLTSFWYMVGSVPNTGFPPTFLDTMPDSIAIEEPVLQLDNDVPVTALLTTPANLLTTTAITPLSVQSINVTGLSLSPGIGQFSVMTVDVGDAQEIIYVLSVNYGANSILAYFQNAHPIGTKITCNATAGQPCNIGAFAFSRIWLAGDPNNPNTLYYSKIEQVESFSPQNTLLVGAPDDPIMAVAEMRGQLFVFTIKTIYTVIAIGDTPYVLPTGAEYGCVGNFAFAVGETEIWYVATNGVYVFNGANASYVSAPVEWLWQGKNFGPIAPTINTFGGTFGPLTYLAKTRVAYFHDEVFFSYVPLTGPNNIRLIFDITNKRWRNDDAPVTCMLNAKDLGALYVARSDQACIMLDRFRPDGDYNISFSHLAFTALFQTPFMDLGKPNNQKNFQNLSLDVDTGGQDLFITLYFNNTTSTSVSFTVNQNGRAKVRLPINSGIGQLGYNIQVQAQTTVTTAPVTIWQMDFEGVMEAQNRDSFDTYFLNYNLEGYKFVKQGWFEYVAADAGGINCSVFLDGSTTAAFTFNLPQSTTRQAGRVRFPANKARLWRFVFTSASPFRLYNSSYTEFKSVCVGKGYNQEPIISN